MTKIIHLVKELSEREQLIMAAGIMNTRGSFMLTGRRVIPSISYQYESTTNHAGVELFGGLTSLTVHNTRRNGKSSKRVEVEGRPLYDLMDRLMPWLTDDRLTEFKLLMHKREQIAAIVKETA